MITDKEFAEVIEDLSDAKPVTIKAFKELHYQLIVERDKNRGPGMPSFLEALEAVK